jgi:hypothetical protein
VGQRVADEVGVDAAGTEKILLKRKDAVQFGHVSAELADAAFAPGPSLGGDQMKDRDAAAAEAGGEAEVEGGAVGEDGGGGALGAGSGREAAELAPDRGKVVEDFDETDDGQGGLVSDGADACGAHFWAGAAEEGGLGQEAGEGADEASGIAV